MNECCCHDDKGWEHGLAYQRDTCVYQDNSVIGCFACSGLKACYGLDNAHVGDKSCNGERACNYDYLSHQSDVPKERLIIGANSCNKDSACSFVQHQTIGITIGDDSCNAKEMCTLCEGGSVVPDGTCNDVNNVDEVGTLTTGDKRCRACFVSTFYIFSSFELMMYTNHTYYVVISYPG